MNLVKDYSSDDSDSELVDLPGISAVVKHRYTQAPKGISSRESFSGYVFLECSLSKEIRNTLNNYISCLSGFTSLLQDSLTASDLTPHVSLSYNVVLQSMDHYDAFIKRVQLKSPTTSTLKFSQLILLPNPEKTKLFLGLKVERSEALVTFVDALNEIIQNFEQHYGTYNPLKENKSYDADALHLSIAECPYIEPYPQVPALKCSDLTVTSYQLCCSRGLQTVVL